MSRVSKHLKIDWSSIPNAFSKRRILKLRSSEGKFSCDVENCLHDGFKSARGLRKHIESRHPWYFYFDSEPSIKEKILEVRSKRNSKREVLSAYRNTFSIEDGIGKSFLDWLKSDCGGGRNNNDAVQSCRRALKFLTFSIGSDDIIPDELTSSFVDTSLGSAVIVTNFLKMVQEVWEIGYSGTYNYLVSLGELQDFRKSQGVSNEVLRSFSITEVYLRRGKRNLARKKKADYSRNLDLETLMTQNNWADINEMEKVIPFHLPKFKTIVEICKNKPNEASPSDLVFCTRFITTFLFLRVKCTRPMTYQHLTVSMYENCKNNGGFVDQRKFKTYKTFLFDSVLFDKSAMQIIDLYVLYCRPLLKPKCDFLLVTSAGKMCKNLCHSMILIVHSAINKYINPTRYRQIIETASSDNLTLEEQAVLSEDQKHSSEVAKIHYKKKQSRVIAQKGKEAMEKLTGSSRTVCNTAISNVLESIDKATKNFDMSFFNSDVVEIDSESVTENSENSLSKTKDGKNILSDVSNIMQVTPNQVDSGEVKTEEEVITRNLVRFTEKEDECLRLGMQKHGLHNWSEIISDKTFSFHSSRTRDSIRVRAGSLAFKRKFPKN